MQPKGLVLDQNAIAPADGAMRSASHVVVDQPGIVRARPTNKLSVAKATETTDKDYSPRQINVYGDEAVCISSDGSAWRLEDEGAVITGNAVPPTQAQIPRMLQARGSLYHTSTTGIQKHLAAGTATIPAGVEAHVGPMAGGVVAVSAALGTTLAGGPLPGTPLEGRVYFDTATVIAGDIFEWYKTRGATNFQVFIVIKRTDANGYVRRSPPTRLPFQGTALPTADAFLWQTYTVTSADVSAGYFLVARVLASAPDRNEVFVSSVVNDDLLGEALYTNPGQQGALGAKYCPPSAAELASFAGCTWYGNTVSKHRMTLGITNVAGSTAAANVDATNQSGLLGAITTAPLANGTTTTGLATVTGVSDDFEKFMRVGMFVTDATNSTPASAGTAFPADTTVLSWAAGAPGTIDITVSANLTATGPRDVLIGDVVTVGGRKFYAWDLNEVWSPDENLASGRRVFGIPGTTISATGRNSYAAQTLAAAINYESIYDTTFRIRAVMLGEPYVYSSTVSAPADILLEEIGVGGSAFTVSSSNPESFSPDATSLTSTNDAEVGGIMWSAPDEPEAVPLPNFARVGNALGTVLALTPLRSSLLIWKTDGLFRVTGVAPSGWRIDPVDTQIRLVASGAVDVAEGVAFGWTDAGVVRATETNAQAVSQPIDDMLKAYAATIFDAENTPPPAWLTCWRSENLVLLGLPGNIACAPVMALSTVTGAWTTFWQRDGEEVWTANYDALGSRLRWSREVGIDYPWELRIFDRGCLGADRTYTLSTLICDSPYTTIEIEQADCGTWVPNPGDWVARKGISGNEYRRITAVDLTGSTYTLTLESAFAAGTGEGVTWDGIEGLHCVMEWQNVSPPSAWSRVRTMQAHMDGVQEANGPGTIYLAQGGTTSLSAAAVLDGNQLNPTTYSRPYRYGVPRAIARHAHLYPKTIVNALGYAWRLHALAVEGEPRSVRVRR